MMAPGRGRCPRCRAAADLPVKPFLLVVGPDLSQDPAGKAVKAKMDAAAK